MLLIDADILAYKVGFKSEEDQQLSYVLASLNSAVSNWLTPLVSVPFFVDGTCDYQLFVTGNGNFRNEVFTEYKSNRKDKAKPTHLGSIMEHLVDNWKAVVAQGEEADDLIGIESTKFGDRCLIITIDKDFDQLPGWHYNPDRGSCYYVTPEEGLRFFYKQLLTGDRVDNIIGLHGIGEKKATTILEACETEEEMYNNVIAAYMEREELSEDEAADRVLVNGRLLWLRREPNQMWTPPC
jgi:DNA polymerase I